MLFKKPAQTAQVTPHSYEWDNSEYSTQSLWVAVRDWQYKVLPSRRTKSFGSWIFQFEGVASTSPLDGVSVVGSVEVLERDEVPGMLSDHWKEVPDNVEGYAFFMKSTDMSIPPSFGLTLYCQESAIDWVYRAFLTASSSKEGGIGIELNLDCPNKGGGSFWSNQWQEEWLRVVSWQLFAGAQLRSPTVKPLS